MAPRNDATLAFERIERAVGEDHTSARLHHRHGTAQHAALQIGFVIGWHYPSPF